MSDTRDWAREQLAFADFGHVRRVDRAVEMLRRAAERPSGQLTRVFDDAAELQAAYNFVEGAVPPAAIVRAFASAALAAASGETVNVVIDGTSLSLTDRTKTKGFGSVGKREFPTRGLKVIDAIAVSPDGVPLGMLDLHFWARAEKGEASRFVRRRSGETEVRHWVDVIASTGDLVRHAGIRPHFIIDREGDCADMLRAVADGGDFTIRAAQYRRICLHDAKRRGLLETMKRVRSVGRHRVTLPRSSQRRARIADLEVRHARVVLDLPDRQTGGRGPLEVTVVWATERRAPHGEAPLDWMLLTSDRVRSRGAAVEVLRRYCLRWRVEDFHRTWKAGRCRVEDSQLRSTDHVVRWATMLAAVALRVERLKHLARTEPDAPATAELSPLEIDALRAAKRHGFTKRTEVITDDVPSMRLAVRWIAQMGGFHGREHVQPGAATLGRGLERLMTLTKGFALGLKTARK